MKMEGTFVFQTIIHHQNFPSTDSTTKLLKKLYTMLNFYVQNVRLLIGHKIFADDCLIHQLIMKLQTVSLIKVYNFRSLNQNCENHIRIWTMVLSVAYLRYYKNYIGFTFIISLLTLEIIFWKISSVQTRILNSFNTV